MHMAIYNDRVGSLEFNQIGEVLYQCPDCIEHNSSEQGWQLSNPRETCYQISVCYVLLILDMHGTFFTFSLQTTSLKRVKHIIESGTHNAIS